MSASQGSLHIPPASAAWKAIPGESKDFLEELCFMLLEQLSTKTAASCYRLWATEKEKNRIQEYPSWNDFRGSQMGNREPWTLWNYLPNCMCGHGFCAGRTICLPSQTDSKHRSCPTLAFLQIETGAQVIAGTPTHPSTPRPGHIVI